MTHIVMLVKDRLKLTGQAIDSLYDTTSESKFTLTVVDDGSEFLTRRMLSGIDRKNFTLLRVEQSAGVLTQLKNIGVEWARQHWGIRRGDWLYLSDNDVWFCPNWLDTLTGKAEVSERHKFRLWGGQVHPFHQPIEGAGLPMLDAVNVIDGPSWLMRWETWLQYGPLDRTTAPGVCKSEEYPFCERLTKTGWKLGVVRPHVVVHTGLTNSKGEPAPGAGERRKMIPEGVVAE